MACRVFLFGCVNFMHFISVINDAQIHSVVTLAEEIWREHYTPIIGAAQVDYMLERYQSLDSIRRQISIDRFHYYLMVSGENPTLGYFSVQLQDDELFLSKIYVRASERGNGYGREALAFIEKMAGAGQLKKIVLTVNKNNHVAIGAYQRMGFEIEKPVVQDIGNGFVMDDFQLTKMVNS